MQAKLGKYPGLWLCLLGLLFFSCRATRHLEPGQLLLKSDPRIETDRLPAGQFSESVRTRANRRTLVPKTALHLHNFGRSLEKAFRSKRPPVSDDDPPKSGGRVIRWLKYRIGEPPVLVDPYELAQDSAQLYAACFARGYFLPQVAVEIDTLRGLFGPKKKARVTFAVHEGIPFRIRHVSLVLRDSLAPEVNALALRRGYFMDSCRLQRGALYDHRAFEAERQRGTRFLRNASFFTFSPDLIRFRVDTMLAVNRTDSAARYGRWLDVDIEITDTPTRYVIDEIIVRIKAPPGPQAAGTPLRIRASELTPALRDSLGISYQSLDSTVRVTFLVDSAAIPRLNFNFIAQRIHLQEGKGYFRNWAQLTQQRLQELGMFQYFLLNYNVVRTERLAALIDLQLAPQYELKAGAETFTRDINFNANLIPNIGANLGLRNKNTFHRSERFELGFSGSVGWNSLNLGTPNYYEVGGEASLQFLKFLFVEPFLWVLPDKIARDLSRFSPNTQLTTSFRVENWQGITQVTPGAALTYRWNHIPFRDRAVSRLTPISVDYIDPNINRQAGFRSIVDQLPELLQRDFSRRFSSRLQYSYTHQNYRRTRSHPTYWYQISVEYGGNLPFLLDGLAGELNQDQTGGDNRFLDSIFYGQYVRGGLEGKLFVPVSARTELVFRGRIGAGTPFNGTPLIPKESRFFTGGINGMRGWQSNTLGPGRIGSAYDWGVADTQAVQDVRSLLGTGGEYALELNAEFRFDAGSYLELAIFTDAGNVWMSRRSEAELGTTAASLRPENLRLGWDAGIGFRFDFSFLILRADLGQQLFAPDIGWVLGNPLVLRPNSRRQINLGIGYPF